jgi:transcriptional regulator with XRE-family HTH domain
MSFSKVLLEFRAKHDLTQTQLADIIGVGIVMIYRYENKISNPTAKNKIIFENKMKEWEEKHGVL